MKISKLLGVILAILLVLSLNVSVMAADITTAGSTGTVPVTITTEPAIFSVTVPTSISMSVSSTGIVTVPTTAKVINNSAGPIKVSNITVSGLNSWVTVDNDLVNMGSEKVGSKKIALTINGSKTTGNNTFGFNAVNFPKLDGVNETSSDELPLVFTAKLPAQKTALTDASIVNVLFTVAWDE